MSVEKGVFDIVPDFKNAIHKIVDTKGLTVTFGRRSIDVNFHYWPRPSITFALKEDSMKEKNYIEEEKHTLEAFEQYKNGWITHGGIPKFVDELYADSTEVLMPLQHVYLVEPGQSKENWRNMELEIEKLFPKKDWKVVNYLVQDNQVAAEFEVEFTRIDGEVIKTQMAVFLTFDSDGRIICDHTYGEGLPFKERIEKGDFDIVPDFKQAIQKILDSQ
jgi:hypothetical protein